MTALEAITQVDGKQYNVFPLADKLGWLGQAEEMVRALLRRCGREAESAPLEADTVLLAPSPYDALYGLYLEAQIHYANQEYQKFNNAIALFSQQWQEYANFLRRGCDSVSRRNFF